MEDEMTGAVVTTLEFRTPADRLEEIARRCQTGEPLHPDHSCWLGEAIDSYLGRTATSLEEALGLRYGRGGVPWRREKALRERDAALRELADEFFADLSICKRSDEIATLALRYGASAWRHDCDGRDMPESYAGTPREYLWRAFRSGAAMPLSERQVRNIVSGCAAPEPNSRQGGML
jgi:hypothetical protein